MSVPTAERDPVGDGDEPAGQVAVDPRSPGAQLAAARRACDMSLDDVAATTRIRATVVRDIERDDYGSSGGHFYARAHLRTIARAVGADGAELIREYDDRAGVVDGLAPVPGPEADAATAAMAPRPQWALAGGVVAVVVATVALATSVAGPADRSGANAPIRRAASSPHRSMPALPTPRPRVVPAPTRAVSARASTPRAVRPAAGVTLRVSASSGSTWMRVTTAGGARLFEGVVAPGRPVRVHDAGPLTARFGNGVAATVTVNDRRLGMPCHGGVCTVRLTRATTSLR